MKRKKSMLTMFGVLCCLLFGTMAYAASSSGSVQIWIGEYQKQTSAVGLSKSATCYMRNDSDSETTLAVRTYACYAGYPYTIEYSGNIARGSEYKYVETQAKDSNYYIQITGNYRCNGYASVRAN